MLFANGRVILFGATVSVAKARVEVRDSLIVEAAPHLVSVISTTSFVCTPLEASKRPSLDQSKEKIRLSLNSVICFAGDPSIGCVQRLSTPPR